jgi:DNA-binding NtrC family response regulator
MDTRVLLSVQEGPLREHLADVLSDYSPEFIRGEPPGILSFIDRNPTICLLLVEESPWAAAFDVLDAAKKHRDDLAVILLSGDPTIEQATEAIRRGAEDYVPVPFSGDVLRKEVQRILDAADLRERVESLRHFVKDAYGFEKIVSHSTRMRPVFERARAAARSHTPVLITGETGTGKELIARAIHANSRLSSKPFIPVNCAALPGELVESELFGHRRGAFSGAHRDYPGLFVAAHGGTLFLDEISELSSDGQAKLLRAVQDGEIRPIGGLASRRVDVRFIAASNRKLTDLRGEALREDLFFRLSVLVIELPPLRERRGDIPLLASHFLAGIRARDMSRVESLDVSALEVLEGYPFPGNVRELENMLESVCTTLPRHVLSIRAEDVREWLRRRGRAAAPPVPEGLPLKFDELQRWAIGEALRRTHGNKREAAHVLGISRDTLYRKLHELGIELETGSVRMADKPS